MTAPVSIRFADLFDDDRTVLFNLTGLAPLTVFEQANEHEYEELRNALLMNAGNAYVARELDERHKKYRKVFDPRLKKITDRLDLIREAMRRGSGLLERGALKAQPQLAAKITTERLKLDEAVKTMRGVGKGVARHLNAILRRGKLERVGLEALHAAILLSLFTFGFGWIGDRVCGWVSRAVQQLPPRACNGLWVVALVTLFAVERWFFGPRIDDWLEKRVSYSTHKALGLYYVGRTSLEYHLTILEHESAKLYTTLQSHNLL